MRTLLLAMSLIAASPVAYAQVSPRAPVGNPAYPSYNPSNPPMSDDRGAYPYSGQQGHQVATGGQENCGTPDAFKACPALPRRALPDYPPNRPDCGSCKVP